MLGHKRIFRDFERELEQEPRAKVRRTLVMPMDDVWNFLGWIDCRVLGLEKIAQEFLCV